MHEVTYEPWGKYLVIVLSDVDQNNCKVNILLITKLHLKFPFRRWSIRGEIIIKYICFELPTIIIYNELIILVMVRHR